MRFVPLGLVLVAVAALWAVGDRGTPARAIVRRDITYEGPIGTAVEGDIGAGGGTISLTFTPGMVGLLRASVTGYAAGSLSNYPYGLVHFDRQIYYDPPLSLDNDGGFAVSLPGDLAGMIRSHMDIGGRIDADGVLSGTASLYVTGAGPDAPWSAGGLVDTPPAASDTPHKARIEGQSAGMTVWLDSNEEVTSFELHGVSLAPCISSPSNLRIFTRPAPVDGVQQTLVAFGDTRLAFVVLTVERTGAVLSGTLAVFGIYSDECGVTLRWSTVAGQALPRDVTHRAPLASGGDVLITFTPDLSGVMRAEVRQGLFEWVVPTSFETLSLRFSHHLYFDPPVRVTDGQFELSIPDQLMGMARDAVRIDGTVADGSVSGTATLVAHVYPSPEVDLVSVAWSGASAIDTPPWPDDTIHVGHIDGQSGTLQLSLNRDGYLTSLTLDNVVAASCFDPPLTLNVYAFFDPPISPSEGIRELVLGGDLLPLSTTVTIDGETISGDLLVPDSVFAPNCTLRLPWTAGPAAETPAATATPQASVSLPGTGGGGEATGWDGLAAVMALAGGGGTLALLGAIARRLR